MEHLLVEAEDEFPCGHSRALWGTQGCLCFLGHPSWLSSVEYCCLVWGQPSISQWSPGGRDAQEGAPHSAPPSPSRGWCAALCQVCCLQHGNWSLHPCIIGFYSVWGLWFPPHTLLTPKSWCSEYPKLAAWSCQSHSCHWTQPAAVMDRGGPVLVCALFMFVSKLCKCSVASSIAGCSRVRWLWCAPQQWF